VEELLRCDIWSTVIILGVIGIFYLMAGASIDYSIQNLKLSYNANLIIIGTSNIIGFISVSNASII
jgi:hypothetical protein